MPSDVLKFSPQLSAPAAVCMTLWDDQPTPAISAIQTISKQERMPVRVCFFTIQYNMFAPFRYDTNVYAGIGEIIILTGSEQTADLNIRADFFA